MVQSVDQATHALYPIVVHLLKTLTDKDILSKSDVSKVLEQAITDLESEGRLVHRPEAISLIRDQIAPGFR